MNQFLAAIAVPLAIGTVIGIAAAQEAPDVPDLKGDWVGVSESLVMGGAAHHEDGDDGPRLSEVEFTLAIDGQDGRRFWGTVSSATSDEPIMGVIGFDGTSIVARDTDGYMEGDLAADGVMELVYSHTGESTVVAATTFTRQD